MSNINEWRDIPGWEGYYQATSNGLVRRHPSATGRGRCIPGRIMKQYINSQGYCFIKLRSPGKTFRGNVHRLIAFTFLGNPPFKGATVNHKNLIKTDNRIQNLEWLSALDNFLHACNLGIGKGESNGRSKLTDEIIRSIRKDPNNKHHGYVTQKARDLGVGSTAIYDIISGKSWKHVKD